MILLSASPGFGREKGGVAFGLRTGISVHNRHDSFSQHEAYASYELPWRWRWPLGFVYIAAIEATSGIIISGSGDTGFIGFAGPAILLRRAGSRLTFEGGVHPTFLSDDSFGRDNLGGSIQFISYLGLKIRLGSSLNLGYRFQHMSNAGLQSPNPGLNMQMLEFEVLL